MKREWCRGKGEEGGRKRPETISAFPNYRHWHNRTEKPQGPEKQPWLIFGAGGNIRGGDHELKDGILLFREPSSHITFVYAGIS